jgi:hypothetical protein
MGATGSPRGAPRGRGSYAAVTQKLLAAGWIAAALLGLCASDATEEEHKSECELRAPETDVATGSGPALVHASYAYFEQANGYLPGCVLSDMDGAAGGGCVHYASLAEAVQRCDALTAAPRGCVPTDAAGQKNGCTCAGITKEGGGAKPYRLGAFPLAAGGSGPVSWQRSAASCSAAADAFVLSVAGGLLLYLGVGGALQARNEGGARLWAAPHRKHWLHLYGLCRDGVTFATAGGRLSGQRGQQQDTTGLAKPLNAASAKGSSSGSGGGGGGGKKAQKAQKAQKVRGSDKNSKSEGKESQRKLAGASASEGNAIASGSGTHSGSAAVQMPTSQAAGDGGRWVRVPT